jgi:hypothetical protein
MILPLLDIAIIGPRDSQNHPDGLIGQAAALSLIEPVQLCHGLFGYDSYDSHAATI